MSVDDNSSGSGMGSYKRCLIREVFRLSIFVLFSLKEQLVGFECLSPIWQVGLSAPQSDRYSESRFESSSSVHKNCFKLYNTIVVLENWFIYPKVNSECGYVYVYFAVNALKTYFSQLTKLLLS